MNTILKVFLQFLFCVWIVLILISGYFTYYFGERVVNRPPNQEDSTFGLNFLGAVFSTMLTVFFSFTVWLFPRPPLCKRPSPPKKSVIFSKDVQFRSASESSSDVARPGLLIVPDVTVVSGSQDPSAKGVVKVEVHHDDRVAKKEPKGQVRRAADCADLSPASSAASAKTQSTEEQESCSATGSSRSQNEEPGIEPFPDEDSEERPEATSKAVELKSCLKEQPYVPSPRRREKETSGPIERLKGDEGSGSSVSSTPRHRAKESSGLSESRSSRHTEKERMLTSAEVRALRERSKAKKAEGKAKKSEGQTKRKSQ